MFNIRITSQKRNSQFPLINGGNITNPQYFISNYFNRRTEKILPALSYRQTFTFRAPPAFERKSIYSPAAMSAFINRSEQSRFHFSSVKSNCQTDIDNLYISSAQRTQTVFDPNQPISVAHILPITAPATGFPRQPVHILCAI